MTISGADIFSQSGCWGELADSPQALRVSHGHFSTKMKTDLLLEESQSSCPPRGKGVGKYTAPEGTIALCSIGNGLPPELCPISAVLWLHTKYSTFLGSYKERLAFTEGTEYQHCQLLGAGCWLTRMKHERVDLSPPSPVSLTLISESFTTPSASPTRMLIASS